MSADPTRTYSTDENRRLAEQLLAVTEEIQQGQLRASRPQLGLLCMFHERVFSEVRDHAGQIRRAGFGSEYLTFGPNHSVRNDEVPDQLLDLFGQLEQAIRSFDSNPDDPDYERSAVHVAVWAHAEVIRIHPFEDGNGRCSRLLLEWILVRLGLRPIAIEVVKEEYRECLNHYFRTRDIQPLLDLYLRLYPGIRV